MFYNSILLHQDHWKYQKILINPDLDPDSKVLIAVITTLIYGVRPVGNQCEEGIKLLAMEVREKSTHCKPTAREEIRGRSWR